MSFAALTAGLAAGLVSAPHCTFMCGPLQAFACRGAREGRRGRALRYQGGRAAAYLAAGAIAGAIGARTLAGLSVSGPIAAAVLSWTLAGAFALAALRLIRARRHSAGPSASRASAPLVTLSRRRELRARLRARLPRGPLALGVVTALLPCGARAGALVVAAAAGDPLSGALVMAGFAAASALGLLAVDVVVGRLVGASARIVLGAVLAFGAALLVVRPLPALLASPGAPPPSCHAVPP